MTLFETYNLFNKHNKESDQKSMADANEGEDASSKARALKISTLQRRKDCTFENLCR